MVRLRKKQRIICAIVGALIIYEVIKKRKRRKKRWWTRPWAREERRQAQGFASNLVKELRSTDTDSFRNFFRYSLFVFLYYFAFAILLILP